MWFTPDVRRILAYSKPVDLRKSIDGLVGLVKSVLAEDPLSGSLFVFVNRRGNVGKLVAWDRTGWCLFAKRLEHGRFHENRTWMPRPVGGEEKSSRRRRVSVRRPAWQANGRVMRSTRQSII
jgi:IS66 Orf2 like protein